MSVSITFSYFKRLKSEPMLATLANGQRAAFVRFLSIIQQVSSDKMFKGKFDFRQCATLKKLSIGTETISARTSMDNLTVSGTTVADANTDSLMVNRQKGIRDLE